MRSGLGSTEPLGVLLGGAHFESPLKTVKFLEASSDILGRRFEGPSSGGCLDSSGEYALSRPPPVGPRRAGLALCGSFGRHSQQ